MAILPFEMLADDFKDKEGTTAAFKINEIIRRLNLQASNIPAGTITEEHIDSDTLTIIQGNWSLLTNGIPNAPDPYNAGVINLGIMNAIFNDPPSAVIDENEIVPRLLFDDSTIQNASWCFKLPLDYHSKLKANFIFTTASTTGDFVFKVEVMATRDDSASPYSESFDSVNSFTKTAKATTNRVSVKQLDLLNDDSAVAGDFILIKFSRIADDVSDTMTGDLALVGLSVQYFKPMKTELIFADGDVITIHE